MKTRATIERDPHGFTVRCSLHGMAHKHITRKQARELRKDPSWFCVECGVAEEAAAPP